MSVREHRIGHKNWYTITFFGAVSLMAVNLLIAVFVRSWLFFSLMATLRAFIRSKFIMSTLYEIVELADGDIVLRRAEEEEAPLVSISFSEEAVYFLDKNKFSVAKAMIEAGLDAASDSSTEINDTEASDIESVVLH